MHEISDKYLKLPRFFFWGISKETKGIYAVLRKKNLLSLFFSFLLLFSFLISSIDREIMSMARRPHLLPWSEDTNTQESHDPTGSADILTLAKPIIFGNR